MNYALSNFGFVVKFMHLLALRNVLMVTDCQYNNNNNNYQLPEGGNAFIWLNWKDLIYNLYGYTYVLRSGLYLFPHYSSPLIL